ncbi:MAG TPA: hypothetical protein VFV34_00450 [Blastocatellia bacterium]|nr:hypothetical protein [Blastocatellia bacterium]
MQVRELIRRAEEQRAVTIERTVNVPGPMLLTLLAERRSLTVAELQAHPDQHKELRSFQYGHVLGPGLGSSEIDDWQSRHPRHMLPADLRALLVVVNGIHLWADLATSRAYFGILPLENWQDAATSDWAELYETAPACELVLSYHDNGDYFLVLDTASQEYRWYDPQDFDNPERVGRTVEDLLDFWWKETAWLDPRKGD